MIPKPDYTGSRTGCCAWKLPGGHTLWWRQCDGWALAFSAERVYGEVPLGDVAPWLLFLARHQAEVSV